MPIKLNGSTSGYTQIQAAATAGNNTLTLPTSGTNLLADNGSGALTIQTVNSGTSNALTLQSNNTTAMTIDTSQNVGIGLTPNTGQGTFQTARIISGGSPVTSGTNDPNQVAMIAAGSVQFSFGALATGTGWVQMRNTANFASNYDISLQPNGGSLLIGTTTANGKVTIKTAGNATATGFSIVNSGSVALFNIREDGVFYTGLAPNSPYNLTTASAANMVVDSAGGVLRSTSSLRYKQNIQNYGKGLSDLAKLRPVTFNSKPKEGDENPDTATYAGFIAEEVHEAGLTEFVQYNNEGQPDALAYANMVALLTKAIQEQQTLITAQAADIAALKAKVGV